MGWCGRTCKSGSCILDELQGLNGARRQTCKEHVAVVWYQDDKGLNKHTSGFSALRNSLLREIVQFPVTCWWDFKCYSAALQWESVAWWRTFKDGLYIHVMLNKGVLNNWQTFRSGPSSWNLYFFVCLFVFILTISPAWKSVVITYISLKPVSGGTL